MNNYSGINPQIVSLVEKYAHQLEKSFCLKIPAEDFQQQLMISVVTALKKFDIRQGSILSFVNRVLFLEKKKSLVIFFVIKEKQI